MITFSPDDVSILASAVDNDVSAFSALDGRKLFALDAPRTGSPDNYSRSYFVRQRPRRPSLLPCHCP